MMQTAGQFMGTSPANSRPVGAAAAQGSIMSSHHAAHRCRWLFGPCPPQPAPVASSPASPARRMGSARHVDVITGSIHRGSRELRAAGAGPYIVCLARWRGNQNVRRAIASHTPSPPPQQCGRPCPPPLPGCAGSAGRATCPCRAAGRNGRAGITRLNRTKPGRGQLPTRRRLRVYSQLQAGLSQFQAGLPQFQTGLPQLQAGLPLTLAWAPPAPWTGCQTRASSCGSPSSPPRRRGTP